MMKRLNTTFSLLIFGLMISGLPFCSAAYERPYEADKVSRAVSEGLVLSKVYMTATKDIPQSNFRDYYYKGYSDGKITLELREYFVQRTAVPQIKREKEYAIDKAGVAKLEASKIEVYRADSDELVFRVIQ